MFAECTAPPSCVIPTTRWKQVAFLLLAAKLAAATTDTVRLHAQVDIREFLGGKGQTVDIGLLLSGRQIVMSIELHI